MNSAREPQRYAACVNMNFLRQGFRRLSYLRHLDQNYIPHSFVVVKNYAKTTYQTLYQLEWWYSHYSDRNTQVYIHVSYIRLYVWQNGSYCRSKFYIVEIGIFDLFDSCDLDLDPMIFMYELDPQSMKICRMCKYALPTSSLLKVVIWQISRPKLYTTQFCGWSKTMKRPYIRNSTSWCDGIDMIISVYSRHP